VKCVHIINGAKVRAFFAENKVCFARAEQLALWFYLARSKETSACFCPLRYTFSQLGMYI